MIHVSASERTQHVRIERPIAGLGFDAAGSGEWEKVADEWVGIVDMLPSRGERLTNGINIAARPARVRTRYRDGITPEMRMVLLRWDGEAWVPADRVMQIVSGPAELGQRAGLEFMVVDFSTAGGSA